MCSLSVLVTGKQMERKSSPFVEGVVGITHEKTVGAIHHAEPADCELVVEGHGCQCLHVAERGALLEGEDLDAGHCENVESRRVFLFVGVLCSHGVVSLI